MPRKCYLCTQNIRKKMSKASIHCAVLALLLMVASCGIRQKKEYVITDYAMARGDSTIYGLVCDGSNDSVVVFLHEPYDGSDPDTLDILDAYRQQQVFGSLRIGDKVAIMRDTADAGKASRVIVTQDLMGQWCYKVKPRLKRRGRMEGEAGEMQLSVLSDSLKKMLNKEYEYGFALKIDSMAQPIGMRARSISADENSPVEYPKLKRYRQWYISNGRLLLAYSSAAIGNTEMQELSVDTADLVMLTADTLVLRLADGEHRYYRKNEEQE